MNTHYSGNNYRAPSSSRNDRKTLNGDEIPIKKEYFNYIQNGEKTVEGRIYSFPFTKACKGDIVTFKNQNQKVMCRIIEVVKYNSFYDMLDKEGVRNCLPDVASVEAGVKIYHGIQGYEEKAKRNGVIAIRIEKYSKNQFPKPASHEVVLPVVKSHLSSTPGSFSSSVAEKLLTQDRSSSDHKTRDEGRYKNDSPSRERSERRHSHEYSREKSSSDRNRDYRKDSDRKSEDRRHEDSSYAKERSSRDYYRSSDYRHSDSDRRSEKENDRYKSHSSRSYDKRDRSRADDSETADRASRKRKRERDEDSSSDTDHQKKKAKTDVDHSKN